eukprot:Skav200275  [mRNA]  locus=scaffold93:123255:131631:- [translate_table: standard]
MGGRQPSLGDVPRGFNVNGEERNHRERLEMIQGEFLNPVVALRMRAKHSPYRRQTLYDQLKEIRFAEDACTKALRADRLEGWTRSTETTTRHVLKIDDDADNRVRPKSVRKSDAGADMVFMMDNADVLEAPVQNLVRAGEYAQKHREDEERRQEICQGDLSPRSCGCCGSNGS